jgi:hypothetical protein
MAISDIRPTLHPEDFAEIHRRQGTIYEKAPKAIKAIKSKPTIASPVPAARSIVISSP